MFTFDQSALPQIVTRKALIAIDYQNDFCSPDGSLPVVEPDGYIDRTVELASAFRGVGLVVWVKSQFRDERPVAAEQIVASDSDPEPQPPSRRRKGVSTEALGDDSPPDSEAFLSQSEPKCVLPGTSGCEMVSIIDDAAKEHRDMVVTKSRYSALNSTQLLHTLRANMAMELFICGSLANIGVYATALDAAQHGMAITIVEDCCGYRSDQRQTRAISSLIELTGCEVASPQEVLDFVLPKPARQPETPERALKSSDDGAENDDAGRKSQTPEIVKDMTGLKLGSESPSPIEPPAKPPPKASMTSDARPLTDQNDKSAVLSMKKHQINSDDGSDLKNDKEGNITPSLGDAATPKDPKSESPDPTKVATMTVSETIAKEVMPSPPAKDLDGEISETPAPANDEPAVENSVNPQSSDSEGEKVKPQQLKLCEGDMDIIENVLPATVAEGIFDTLREEVEWQRMSHQGGEVPRLVAVQGEVAEGGSHPVYRHPSDESPPLLPFSPTVLKTKEEIEKHLGHPLNHVLIQYYRTGNDYISEHSDKTLDIAKESYIANVSLGAERSMVLRTKRLDKDPSRPESSPVDKKRKVQRARLPHNSLCRMGLQTNMRWLHAIRQDKRAEREKSATELAYNGGRISLTFRQIGTFMNAEQTLIWGQGAIGKTREEARPITNGQTPEAIKLLKAFGTENHSSNFDWDAYYGRGFDVLHITNAPRLFVSSDPIVNMRIIMMLAEYGVGFAKGSMGSTIQSNGTTATSSTLSMPIKFVDNDPDKTTVEGDIAIMLYLDTLYGSGKAGSSRTNLELAKQLTYFQQAICFLDLWRACPKVEQKRNLESLKEALTSWDDLVRKSEGGFLSGADPSLPDFMVWPVLHAIIEESGEEGLKSFAELKKYYQALRDRPGPKKALGD